MDTTIAQLSATFVANLQVEQEKLQEAGEDLEDTTSTNYPQTKQKYPNNTR